MDDQVNLDKLSELSNRYPQDPERVYREMLDFQKKYKCGVCFDDFKLIEMYTVDCPNGHKFCHECMRNQVSFAVNTDMVGIF